MPQLQKINVLFLASEADPLIKIGGLGDVAGSLPHALREINRDYNGKSIELDVRLVMPYHPAINKETYSPNFVAEFPISSKNGNILAKAFTLEIKGLPIYLIAGAPIDQETSVYSLDSEADGFKYVFFSMAALKLAQMINWKPDILHANDWHSAAAVYSLALRRPLDDFYNRTSSLLTVHNLPYLGSMTSTALDDFELPAAIDSDLPAWAQHMALPLGLLGADSIVAVSPHYAEEILMEDFGSGLSSFLSAHQEKISGIINGLDTIRWDPATDNKIMVNFSVDKIIKRSANKSFLQEAMGLLNDAEIPLLAMVTRMDPQKGVDLAVSAIRSILKSSTSSTTSLQAVFLGKGDPILEKSVRQLEKDFPNQLRARIMYDERLSHHIYAGADAFLMPSRYEPCGLSQMIAMHYGCVPIARATGGLSDTIHDPASSGNATGFLFPHPKPAELAKTIQRALEIYFHDPQAWQEIQINGMRQDFSWNRSAEEYLKRYKMILR